MEIRVELSTDEAEAFAQFLKRASFKDFRDCAADDDEAYFIRDAGERIRDALASAGIAPR
jgi:hypothetical protein